MRAEEAIKKIYSRFSELEKKRSNILNTIDYTPCGYYQLCIKVHAFLYQNILNTAGKVRAVSDPNFGNVYLRKLNYCHSVRIKYKQCLARFNPNSDNLTNEEAYWESIRGKYIGYLVNYWNQSVGSIDDIEI